MVPNFPLGKGQLKEKSRAVCKHPDVHELNLKIGRQSTEEKGKKKKTKELKILELIKGELKADVKKGTRQKCKKA